MHIQNKKRFILMTGTLGVLIIIILVITVLFLGRFFSKQEPVQTTPKATETTNSQTAQSSPAATTTTAATDNQTADTSTATAQSTADPSDVLILVNKTTNLDQNYVPADLVWVALPGVRDTQMRTVAATALGELFNAATKQGLTLYCCSGYRSYATQKELYAQNVSALGQSEADLVSAKPGQSEHQTGLAMDVTAESVGFDLLESFGDTKEGQFVKNNAYLYGFIIRYPNDKTSITGYSYEPWHLRYVGKDVAKVIHDKDITFEEYLQSN